MGDDVFPPTYPEYSLDLNINGSDIDWDNDTTYNTDHKYSTMYTGTGSVITFGIYDTGYGDNSGSLSADIFVKLW